MLNQTEAMPVETPMAAVVGAETSKHPLEKNTVRNGISPATARAWFAQGNRVPYDRRAKEILPPGDTTVSPDIVHVFRRITNDATRGEDAVWTSFLPG